MGLATADDAAVYRLTDDLAIVATVDYFTPIVDDPYAFGQIAAANALSDIYAMGARPLFALNLVGFPRGKLPLDVLGAILQGGAEKAHEAGIHIIGGHSIDDPEPKYGLCVIGQVHPERVITKAGARPGDVLFLTKPLGSGIISTAIKRGLATPELIAEITTVMAALNRPGAEAMTAVGVDAATDITGYGLLGHLREMVQASGVRACVYLHEVPVIPAVWELARAGIVPGGTRRNLESLEGFVTWDPALDETARLVLADAQTSGGLLIAVPRERADDLATALRRAGALTAAPIGEIETGEGIIVRP